MREIHLFNYNEKPPEPKPIITYGRLNIHQKINYRANQAIFCGTVYLNRYYYFVKPLHQPVYDRLTKDYFTHYKLNAGGFNRLDNLKKENKKTLFD